MSTIDGQLGMTKTQSAFACNLAIVKTRKKLVLQSSLNHPSNLQLPTPHLPNLSLHLLSPNLHLLLPSLLLLLPHLHLFHLQNTHLPWVHS